MLYLIFILDITGRDFSANNIIEYLKKVMNYWKIEFSRNGIIHKNIIEWLLEE